MGTPDGGSRGQRTGGGGRIAAHLTAAATSIDHGVGEGLAAREGVAIATDACRSPVNAARAVKEPPI